MNKVLLGLMAGALALGGAADAAKKPPAKKPAKAKVQLVCPVMGAKIASPKTAVGKSVYNGKTYYFCCAGCKPEFDKNPEKFIKPVKNEKKKDKQADKNTPKPKVADALVCPVTNQQIASKDKAAGSSTHDGETYYFCCGGCKSKFDADPASYVTKKDDKKAEAAAESITCAVTGEKIASKSQAAGSSVHEGKTYYFCCGGCKSKFDADPAKYVTKKDDHASHNH